MKQSKREASLESQDSPTIGALLYDRRAYHGWTLADVSSMTGISVSTLSKIENGLLSPTYDKILQLSKGLQVEIGDLLTARPTPGTSNVVLTRQSVNRQLEGYRLRTKYYEYTYFNNEVAHKRIIPIHIDIFATTVEQMGELTSHFGEEFIYVAEGTVRLYSDDRDPVDLNTGDSVYLDSTMKHGYMSLEPDGAKIMVCCSSATPNLSQTLREIIKSRIINETNSRKKTKLGAQKKTPDVVKLHKNKD